MAASRKRTGTGSNKLESRLDALVADLEALQADVRGLAQGVGAEANDRVTSAIKSAEVRVASAVKAAEEAAEQAVEQAEEWATENLDSLRENVREQPLAALAVSMGVGALLGVLFLRR